MKILYVGALDSEVSEAFLYVHHVGYQLDSRQWPGLDGTHALSDDLPLTCKRRMNEILSTYIN